MAAHIGIIYLILAILSSASMTIILRIFQKTEGNRYGILLGNYITCIALAFFMLPGGFPAPGEIERETVLVGITDGVFFVVSLVLLQTNIRKNGAVLTSAFSRLGLLVPLALGLFLGECPGPWQILGICLVLVALPVLELSGKEADRKEAHSLPLLLVLLVSFGCGDAMAKIFERTGNRGQDELFFFFVFLTAGILCAGLTVYEGRKGGKPLLKKDMLAGIAVGIPNYFSSALLLKALVQLPSFLVYPSISTGTIAVVTLISVALFGEKLSRGKVLALVLIAAALVLLNI